MSQITHVRIPFVFQWIKKNRTLNYSDVEDKEVDSHFNNHQLNCATDVLVNEKFVHVIVN